MTRILFAALAALSIAASPALADGEQPHDGTITPTYSGGYVGSHANEGVGMFDRSRATPLRGGGLAMEIHANEGRVSFDLSTATKVGVDSRG